MAQLACMQCLQPKETTILIKMKTGSIQAIGKTLNEHVLANFWRGKMKPLGSVPGSLPPSSDDHHHHHRVSS